MVSNSVIVWLGHIGDRINPILVKETRQALKSRQFSATFMLLLVASLLVSFGGVALSGPNIDYRAAGSLFFVAYFAVLAFAIFMVVPFGAYRSLAAEQEERTYELLSITTLKPSQIVVGKLLSAMIQMFIYYSAIAPFMAFTYLLKGIDMLVILLVLVMALLGSVAFSMIGLFLATFSTRRGWQVLLSVVMITGLGFATIGSVPLAWSIVEFAGGLLWNEEFWIGTAGFMTGYVTTFALLLQLSVSQLTFESDNRSSKVRFVLAVQFLAALGWVAWGWIEEQGHRDFLEVMAGLGCFYWAAVGSFLIAEPVGLSRRVARQIPRNGLIRSLTTLFFPGPGTGLAFVLIHLICILSVVGLAELIEPWTITALRVIGTRGDATAMTLTMVSYTFFYVGIGAFLVRITRRFRPLPAIGGAAITAILATAGTLIPNFFVMAFRPSYYQTYEFWQITDPFSTLEQIDKSPGILTGLVLVPLAMAGVVFFLNLPAMAREVFAVAAAGTQPRVAVEPGEAAAENGSVELAAAAETT